MGASTQELKTRKKGRLFYGWWVVAAASVQGMFGNGVVSNGFSIYFQPIRQDLGISYTAMSLVFSLARAEGGIAGPLVGWLVDRFGARRMVFLGGLMAGLGLIAISRANAYWQLLVLFAGVVSVGKSSGLGQTLMAAVNQWFIRRKGLAMSILMTSFAGGGAIVVPLMSQGITHLGWRDTVFYTGIFVLLLTLPVSLVIHSRPEDLGLRPDGDDAPGPAKAGEKAAAGHSSQEFTLRQAVRTSAFWLLLVGLTARISATNAMIIHIFPMLEGEGIPSETAAFLVSAMFFLAIPLRFGLGVAGDFLSPRKVLVSGMGAVAVGLLALLLFQGMTGVIIFMLGLALVEGITSVNWILVGQYFGRGRFATIMGLMSMSHNVGMMVSPIFSGWIKDQTGSYNLVMVTFIPLYIIGAIAFALARKPSLPGEAEQGLRTHSP